MLAKKFALGFGLAVVFPVMIHYGVSTFVPQPKWQDYLSLRTYDYQRYQAASAEEKARLDAEHKQLENKRKAAEKRFQRTLFVIAVPLGLAALVFGALGSIKAVGTGLMFGGIFSIMDGYFNYWSELADSWRFISMLLAFFVLMFIGYRKLAK